MTDKTLQTKLLKALNAHYKDRNCTLKNRAYIWDNKFNDFLTDRYGLFADSNDRDLLICHIDFDWNLERWYAFI